mgnify:CR=1 FL=1
MVLEEYKYLWDGSDNGWYLQYLESTSWFLIFRFSEEGPEKHELTKLHRLVPELKGKSLPFLYRKLKGQSEYCTEESYGNIEVRELENKSKDLFLNVQVKAIDSSGYLPMHRQGSALLIEDEHLSALITKKMIEEGVEVVVVHAD